MVVKLTYLSISSRIIFLSRTDVFMRTISNRGYTRNWGQHPDEKKGHFVIIKKSLIFKAHIETAMTSSAFEISDASYFLNILNSFQWNNNFH